MLNKTYRFITVFLVMLLVLGLTLAACGSQEASETEQPAVPSGQQVETPAAQETEEPVTPAEEVELSFEAATYTNDEHDFFIQYPAD